MDLREQKFGIEIEMTGLTRQRAAVVIAEHFGTAAQYGGTHYDEFYALDGQGRKWKVMSDGSIDCQRKIDGRRVPADSSYSVEFVSPICTYDDIPTIQQLVRELRYAGGLVNSSTGIHIHVDAAPFDAPKLRNLVNITASKEDLIYKALRVGQARERYCKKMDSRFLDEINRKKPQTMEELKNIWYEGTDGSYQKYHRSRYRAVNLHSVFQKGTIEIRAFNSQMHAGVIKAYIQFCLAITAQAYNQKSARPAKTVSDNEKYTFRVWLLRLGLIGDEFKTARSHLLKNLEGNIAWKDPAQALRQKERMQARRELERLEQQEMQTGPVQEPEEDTAPGFTMSM